MGYRITCSHVLLDFLRSLLWIRQCYDDLVVKFPGSSSLLLDYAQFCEDILNDQARANKLRHGAVTFEAGRSAADRAVLQY
jgi:hypothetical protein